MNIRFSPEGAKKKSAYRSLWIIGIFTAIFILLLVCIELVSKGDKQRQLQTLTDTINRDITYCYATTGRYPESLDYIKEEYSLTYDEDEFLVNYIITGSNTPPTVTITERKN